MQASKANQQVTEVPRFLQSLYEILHNEDPRIISWSTDGVYFQVLDVARLEREVLPNFRKWTKTRSNVCTFSHDVLTSDTNVAKAAADDVSTPVAVTPVPMLKRQRSETSMGSATTVLKNKVQETVVESPSAPSDIPTADIFFVGIDDLAIDSNWSLSTLDVMDLWALDWTQGTDGGISATHDVPAILSPLTIELELELELNLECEDIDVATQLDWSNAVTDACLAALDSETAVVVADCKPTTVLGIDTELDILDLAF
ncbi:Heat shock transcription factor, partial [Globisporangium splendens]